MYVNFSKFANFGLPFLLNTPSHFVLIKNVKVRTEDGVCVEDSLITGLMETTPLIRIANNKYPSIHLLAFKQQMINVHSTCKSWLAITDRFYIYLLPST